MTQEPGKPTAQPPVRIGIVDMGSNAIRTLVAEIAPGADEPRVLESHREPVRMGRDVFLTGTIPEPTVAAAVDLFRTFRSTCQRHGVRHIRAIATSATREAANRDVIVERIHEASGIEVEVISGTEEALLLGSAVQSRIDLQAGRSLLVDVGGGSVEVLLIDSGKVVASNWYRLGALRLLRALTGAEASGDAFVELLNGHMRSLERRMADRLGDGSIDRYVATGGNIESLADLISARTVSAEGPEEIESHELDELQAEVGELATLSHSERMTEKGLKPDRADTILPAGVVYLRLGRIAGVDRVQVPRVGLKDGLLREVIAGHLDTFHAEHHVETVMASCRALGDKHRFDREHAERVMELAGQLFDQTHALHGLDKGARVLLEAASLLHDVGVAINNARHHKHSWYLIRESDLVGLTDDEKNLVALIARYHRKATPSRQHEEYGALRRKDRSLVAKLASLLRIADALDRQHGNIVLAIDVTVADSQLQIRPTLTDPGSSGLTLEKRAVEEKGKLFEHLFGLPIVISAPPQASAEASPTQQHASRT